MQPPTAVRSRPAAAGIEHRQRCVVGEDAAAGHDVGDQALMQRLQAPAGGTDPADRVERLMSVDKKSAVNSSMTDTVVDI